MDTYTLPQHDPASFTITAATPLITVTSRLLHFVSFDSIMSTTVTFLGKFNRQQKE